MSASSASWDRFIGAELSRFKAQDRLRTPVPVERLPGGKVLRAGRRLINFSSNDYLGLSVHPALIEASRRALKGGAGAGASRLLSGGSHQYHELEARIAAFKNTEAALVFSNGYMANLGAITALAGREDAIFSDRLNHASISDGAGLSGATVYRYRHADVSQLEQMLKEADSRGVRRKLIVTESLFGMDGDVAPLREIVELKRRYGAALMVDEAHACGVFGPKGQGLVYEAGLETDVDLHIGTFGKAFGSYGAFAAGGERWISYLVNAGRTFIYTTALPPAVIGAICTSLDLVPAMDEERLRLRSLGERVQGSFADLGLDTGISNTHIVPVIVGESGEARAMSRALEVRGVLAGLVRPPVVPSGKARLRFSLAATHQDSDIEFALQAVGEAVKSAFPVA